MNDDGGGSGETWSTLVAGVAGPPPNEFPGVLAPNRLVWRSQQAAVSVVAVYAYTTGLEFALFAFVPRIAVEEIADGLGGRRSSPGKLAFTVQGKPATVLNAEYREHTFRSHMWFSSRGHGDVVMGLEWPDAVIKRREFVVRAEDIHEARTRIVTVADPA